MSQLNDILQHARERATQSALPYSGAVTPEEAHALLTGLGAVRLVDVRSAAEWQFVGGPEQAVRIEWKSWPGMVPNPNFLEQLQHQVDKESVLLFLCRTGARSHDAAAAAAAHGFTECYNILEGFEGDKNADGQRGAVNGWQGRKLPWSQS
ncbi:rhodanese-like domain-containing protein [Burkholderiaceae bacterium DAT-1]|nr:rhodanese-like domain-containing protein [Burkholderiaceae bacterium DAT-1]